MRILICDDDAQLLDLLVSALLPMGHDLVPCESAEVALEKAAAAPPDLALVDLQLPGMDGLDLTRALKERFGDRAFLPVILITASDEIEARVRGFAAGGDDYLSKPVNLHELKARVHSLIQRREQDVRLRAANERLREADLLKKELAALVVHDLRNPLSALSVQLELIEADLGEREPEVRQTLADCRQITAHALSMLTGLLDVAQLEEGNLRVSQREVAIAEFVPRATRYCAAYLKHRKLKLETEITPPDLKASFDPDLIGRVLENLVNNGSRYAPMAGRLRLAAAIEGRDLVFTVANNGPAIPVSERERIFDKYYRLEERRADARSNRGLGLYFCRLAVAAHGGSVTIEERPDFPACFVIRIPQPAATPPTTDPDRRG